MTVPPSMSDPIQSPITLSDCKAIRSPQALIALLQMLITAFQPRRADSAMWPQIIDALQTCITEIEAALPRNQRP